MMGVILLDFSRLGMKQGHRYARASVLIQESGKCSVTLYARRGAMRVAKVSVIAVVAMGITDEGSVSRTKGERSHSKGTESPPSALDSPFPPPFFPPNRARFITDSRDGQTMKEKSGRDRQGAARKGMNY
jgi:hypothetical protein